MQNRGKAILIVTLLFAFVSWAQTAKEKTKPTSGAEAKPAAKSEPAQKAPPAPKPGPELNRLAYFAGNWTSTGTMQPGDFGPGGKFTGKEHNEWFPGKFFLVSHADGNGAMGPMKELSIFGYDPEHKVYTYHAINSMGEAESFTGTVKGSDWTWTSDATIKGKTMKMRFLLHEDSATAYSMSFEASTDGGKTWNKMMDGKATKAAAAAAAQ
jgi:hypothetical protein